MYLRVYALRIVPMDKILRFTNTFIINIIIKERTMHFLSTQRQNECLTCSAIICPDTARHAAVTAYVIQLGCVIRDVSTGERGCWERGQRGHQPYD